MKATCDGCGVTKPVGEKELYPYPGLINDTPLPPFFLLCVQGRGEHEGDWRHAVVCHGCFHKLDVDMWIASECWKSIDPRRPFVQLMDHDDRLCSKDVAEALCLPRSS